VFAYYPAAVQAGWVCGMMTPAGIESINYFLTDPYMNPQVPTPEKLLELPSAYSYFPLVTPPDINLSLPVDRKKRLTLLAPNNPCKISDAVIKVWSDCLKALPESDLIIKIYGQDTEFRLKREFAKLQVDPNRIKSLYTIDKLEDLLSFYTNEVDIVLDTWPCTGCLTSAEVMWMGVPVITMIGNTFLHRQTWTILKQTHTEELGADTDVGYVQSLVSLASNRNRMLKFRTDIRGLMNAAPIRQPEVIAAAIVKACQSIWLDACETKHRLMEKILV
jgi:predicted O-linked N-acetylglucosamine transferase (SPINDLY family)